MENTQTLQITCDGADIRILRESLAVALDELIEYEKTLEFRDADARRRVARDIEATASLMVKVREQLRRDAEDAEA